MRYDWCTTLIVAAGRAVAAGASAGPGRAGGDLRALGGDRARCGACVLYWRQAVAAHLRRAAGRHDHRVAAGVGRGRAALAGRVADRPLTAGPALRRRPPRPELEPRRWPLRAIILRVAFLVLALVGLYVVWPSLVDIFSSWPRLRVIEPGWYAAMVAAVAGSFVLRVGAVPRRAPRAQLVRDRHVAAGEQRLRAHRPRRGGVGGGAAVPDARPGRASAAAGWRRASPR